jgi:hypothetical protein
MIQKRKDLPLPSSQAELVKERHLWRKRRKEIEEELLKEEEKVRDEERIISRLRGDDI